MTEPVEEDLAALFEASIQVKPTNGRGVHMRSIGGLSSAAVVTVPSTGRCEALSGRLPAGPGLAVFGGAFKSGAIVGAFRRAGTRGTFELRR